MPKGRNGGGVCVDGGDIVPALEKPRRVSPAAAAGVKDSVGVGEAAFGDLIEKVNVDAADLVGEVAGGFCGGVWRGMFFSEDDVEYAGSGVSGR